MAKKYVPSGYQIINLTVENNLSLNWGTDEIPEEIQYLINYVVNENYNKKALLINIDVEGNVLCGFPSIIKADDNTSVDIILMSYPPKYLDIAFDLSAKDITFSYNQGE